MRQNQLVSRRTALGAFGAAAALPLLQLPARAAGMALLELYGPPAGPSVVLAHASATGALAKVADAVQFKAWRNPDELRAGLTSGSIQLSVVPVQAAANLHNRGFPIKLANVMTNGLLYILTGVPEIKDVGDLAGRSIAVPFRGDTPEIIFLVSCWPMPAWMPRMTFR